MTSPRATVVGAGPNGLTAAAVLARAGWRVDVFEANDTIGGAARSSTGVFGSDTIVDWGAAAHPFGVVSPAFRDLELERYGLRWEHPALPMAHPLFEQPAVLLHRDLDATCAQFAAKDAAMWRALHGPVVKSIDSLSEGILQAKRPSNWAGLVSLARFGVRGLPSVHRLALAAFRHEPARALLTGSALHAITRTTQPGTAAFGLLFGALGMSSGWPVVAGGTSRLIEALHRALVAHGGQVHTGHRIDDLALVGDADAIVCALTPRQILELDGLKLDALRGRRLKSWKYGPGVYKVDYLLDGPVPWQDSRLVQAGTVHVGGTTTQMRQAEEHVAAGMMPSAPFVMVCQQHTADPSRVQGTSLDASQTDTTGTAAHRQVLWTYAHVPHGFIEAYPGQLAGYIEARIERFAPGFSSRIIALECHSPAALEAGDANLVGGDIAAGAMSISQLARCPQRLGNLSNTRMGNESSQVPVFMASGANLPGAGVHGMPGWRAARKILKHFDDDLVDGRSCC